jgi:hypothetical protein
VNETPDGPPRRSRTWRNASWLWLAGSAVLSLALWSSFQSCRGQLSPGGSGDLMGGVAAVFYLVLAAAGVGLLALVCTLGAALFRWGQRLARRRDGE